MMIQINENDGMLIVIRDMQCTLLVFFFVGYSAFYVLKVVQLQEYWNSTFYALYRYTLSVIWSNRLSSSWISVSLETGSASSIVVFVFVSSLSSNIQWICYLRSSVIIMYLPCLWSMLVHWITLMIVYYKHK